MNQTTHDDIVTRLQSYMELANDNMKAAADQIRHEDLGDEYAEGNITNINIFCCLATVWVRIVKWCSNSDRHGQRKVPCISSSYRGMQVVPGMGATQMY